MSKFEFADLRAFVEELERRGKLYRWQREVNKDRTIRSASKWRSDSV